MARKKITDLQVVDGRTIIDNVQSPVRLRELPPQFTDEVNLIVCGALTDSDAKKVSEYARAPGPRPTSIGSTSSLGSSL